ncbi:MAG: hypothetical protein DMF67_01685 [Acidobacteria bacterium]|nr:MAG: hypothetical protein DMF67_01685 [Acidobacteriota bacterium]
MKCGETRPRALRRTLVTFAVAACAACLVIRAARSAASGDTTKIDLKAHGDDEVAKLLDAALYTRAEFFGAQARVAFPTVEARNRVAALREQRPDEPRVTLALARLDEKLGGYDTAEKEMGEYVAQSGDGYAAFSELAAFDHRRALFAKEAATLERMLSAAPDGERATVLDALVRLAEAQKLAEYLSPEFFERVIAEHPSDFSVVAAYVERLASKKDPKALEAVRHYRERFPPHHRYFMEKEIALLDGAGRAREAESVYVENFDPFWPDDLSESFYQFLREHDRYRAYGTELRDSLRRDPTNFGVALRLFHFRKHAYEGGVGDIFERVEEARGARHVSWKPEELATAARLLIEEGDADTASRFLYTLVALGQLSKGSPERAKVLYQLFELLSDAGDERLPLTRGDLQFYRDVASSDPHPGIVGGLLSLIFSDKNPSGELGGEDEEAVKRFNRAAAYRIFNAYKEENPTSPELAQMYLDLVRLYSAEGDPRIADEALREFEQRYGDAPRYAEVALKLADCYVLLDRHEDERAVYARVLDYLGRRRERKSPLVPAFGRPAAAPYAGETGAFYEPTEIKPSLVEYPPKSSPGIKAAVGEKSPSDYYDYEYDRHTYRDFLAPDEDRDADDDSQSLGDDARSNESERDEETVRQSKVTYADVLARDVASLANENRTEDVLALYAAEIKKYPDEQGLYEQMLQWLGQTNLFDEQSRVYREALERFPSEAWRDRLARWLLRRERKQEFADYSRELVSKLDDKDAERYLERFIAPRATSDAKSFESDLYLGLYSLAHERFPENVALVRGLLQFYAAHGREDDYRRLLAEYYFVSPELREQFLSHLAERGELRARLDEARKILKERGELVPRNAVSAGDETKVGDEANASDGAKPIVESLAYKLFRADAAARLSNYEESVDAYRELNRLYPATPEFAERLSAFTRSLGQHNRQLLEEAASTSRELADANPADAAYRTRAGEVFAELGDYARARTEWSRLVSIAPGDRESFLDAATVFWDYFQYADALETINHFRRETGDNSAYAFEAGSILEAQHRQTKAIAEYVKALDEDAPAHWRARRRLATLYKRPAVPALIAEAYSRSRDDAGITLGYATLLKELGRRDEASRVLAASVARSRDADFIKRAQEKYSDAEDADGEHACIARLVQISTAPRQFISHSLQLAESYAQRGERDSAASVVRTLLRKFPTNYGVLQEASAVYVRLGLTDDSLRVLRDAAARGRGHYHTEFSRSLAARLLDLNRIAEARRVLEGLHDGDPLDLGAFRELAHIYARAGDSAALRKAFNKTLDSIRASDADPRETRAQVADLRRAMITVFTSLRDYRAAMEQHVEIVNRDPDDDEAVEAAISYAKRYGGADELLSYYQKVSNQAYKNYRWQVVLARIYEAKNDLASAARSYKEAIDNQPEMTELHAALAEVCVKAHDYDAALRALARASELSNDDPQYIRRTAEVLELAGREQEAADVRRKLPAPQTPKREDTRELFADAARTLATDRAMAVEQYRAALDALEAEPYKHELRASEINAYVRAVRGDESLDAIFQRLWSFRQKLIADADRVNGKDAGRARDTLSAFDGALPDAVGATAAEVATGDELARLFASLREKIDASLRASDAHATLALLQNIAHRAGFATLEERVLAAQRDAARTAGDPITLRERIRTLASYYAAAGEYPRALELLEDEGAKNAALANADYASTTAEYARLAGDGARELSALGSYYDLTKSFSDPSKPDFNDDALVARYFDLLHDSGSRGREELSRRASESSSRRALQLVNFLIAKGERELAHAAVSSAQLPDGWKLARQAQLSLALGEFNQQGEAYFADALRPATIGELLAAKTDSGTKLAADDWSRLESDYGRWLYLSGDGEQRARATAALPAVVESRPRDAAAQAELARWYLSQGEARAALEHLAIADEESPDDPRVAADIGSAHFLLGEREQAEADWSKLIAADDPSPDACLLYLKTLAAHGLAAEARDRLALFVAKRLKAVDETYRKDEKFEPLKPLLVALSRSFVSTVSDDLKKTVGAAGDGESDEPLSRSDEDARAAFFRKLCEAAPRDTELAQMIVEGGLVSRSHFGEFYALLVERSDGLEGYDDDYAFTDFMRESYGATDVEAAFDHAQHFSVKEPERERVKWQEHQLEYLIEEGRNVEAQRLTSSVESELARRYARPTWLRLAKVRLELRGGKTEKALNALKTYVGADTPPGLAKISAPSTERLTEALALLREEHSESAAPQLVEATYAQLLALGQYQSSYFVALARVAYESGDATRGDRLLRLMIDLSAEETRDDAAQVASLPEVRARAARVESAELPEESNVIARNEALALAAETAGAFGRFDEATNFRAALAAASPDDYTNRVELARLLAASDRREEAVGQLSGMISDVRAPRSARWQAVWSAAEVAGGRQDLWESLRENLSSAAQTDHEMSDALGARELQSEGRAGEAVDLLDRAAADDPNPLLEFFRGVVDEEAGRAENAARAFADASRSQSSADIATAFGADEDDAARELIHLQLSSSRPYAALKLASLDTELLKQPSGDDARGEEDAQRADTEHADTERVGESARAAQPASNYRTLKERAEARRAASEAELLGLLSVAAEQVRDFDKSIEFERARLSRLSDEGERDASAQRVARLRRLLREQRAGATPPPLVVDGTLVARS